MVGDEAIDRDPLILFHDQPFYRSERTSILHEHVDRRPGLGLAAASRQNGTLPPPTNRNMLDAPEASMHKTKQPETGTPQTKAAA